MGGLANGRFKLALRQLEAFLALESIAPLHLGFYDPAQGIDVAGFQQPDAAGAEERGYE